MDSISSDRRSWNMSRIKSKNTFPEMIVRKSLTRMGARYRLHSKKLPGKPDIVLSKYRTAIFINGCFWHQHKNCKRSSTPKSNAEYWIPKLERNVKRQASVRKEIKKMGWKAVIIWECESRIPDKIEEKLIRILN